MGSTKNRVSTQLVDYDAQVNALTAGRFKDPFSFLGAHNIQSGTEIRVYLPAALRVELLIDGQVISALRYKHSDLFIAELSSMPSSVYQCQVSYECFVLLTHPVLLFVVVLISLYLKLNHLLFVQI